MDSYETAFDAGRECASNAESLCRDAIALHDAGSYGSAVALAILSQEESGKALLLAGSVTGLFPFSQSVFANTRQKHQVKQALGFLCDLIERAGSEIGLREWVDRRIEESPPASDDMEIETPNAADFLESVLGLDELEERFEAFMDSGERAIGEQFKKIQKLEKDRRKQGGLYVDVDRSGQITSSPSTVTADISHDEIEIASRATDMLRGLTSNWTYDFKAYEINRVTMERVRNRIRAQKEATQEEQ